MSGVKDIFLSIVPSNGDDIVFGGGSNYQMGVVKIPVIPQLENISYVEGSKINLISTSQLCEDMAEEVCFLKRGCKFVIKWEEHSSCS